MTTPTDPAEWTVRDDEWLCRLAQCRDIGSTDRGLLRAAVDHIRARDAELAAANAEAERRYAQLKSVVSDQCDFELELIQELKVRERTDDIDEDDRTRIVNAAKAANARIAELERDRDREKSLAEHHESQQRILLMKTIPAIQAERDAAFKDKCDATAERDRIRAAIRSAGFAVMETSGDWSIHDVNEKAKKQQEYDDKKATELINENIELERELAELRRACEPFARIALVPGAPADNVVTAWLADYGETLPTVGDVLALAALLVKGADDAAKP